MKDFDFSLDKFLNVIKSWNSKISMKDHFLTKIIEHWIYDSLDKIGMDWEKYKTRDNFIKENDIKIYFIPENICEKATFVIKKGNLTFTSKFLEDFYIELERMENENERLD